MTQSFPAKPKAAPNEGTRHQRLMELIEAEDAANGEVGCGRALGNSISGSFSTRDMALEDEKLKRFLQAHLGHSLRAPDFDAIATQIQRQLESLVMPTSSQSLGSEPPPASTNVTAHVPTEALKELFQSQLAEFCSEAALKQLIQFSHQIIHKAVLRPRHTWASPIWVLRSETQIYIAQAAGIEEAIAKVKTQHPQETGRLEVITVGGILAPDQVISLATNLL
ncbi:MAG TPA: hypothetical protein IGS53_27505 [Leptolyngbyaceae cyanobacterium M33_DOE_097]|uniref:Uncharacterized protein n=1 Tax=Oscillatoriales cyanobacterium SpSt-418 TaxID=2282169 RepID=A0A7C3PKY6_9CYAN|nr:hypothetical protein [Leptolyngbyaceae cyanobacterium M33_DOE_097]